MNQFVINEPHKAPSTLKKRRAARIRSHHPAANAALGIVGGGLGAAAAAGIGPIVLPAAIIGGLAGYFLTNRIPA